MTQKRITQNPEQIARDRIDQKLQLGWVGYSG
jgi:hypothetical protein